MKINVKINNCNRTLDVEPGDMLVDVLRKNGYLSVKRACDTGSCGTCTILIDGEPIASCSYLAVRAEGHSITTIEGAREEAEKIAEYLNDEGVTQCGYCSPGLVLNIIAMKNHLKNLTEDEIKHYLAGNLCRCTGYLGQLRAIKKYLQEVER
ncbi:MULTISPECIES: (2Fe-2S)-binding protein [Clostridium]|uniref:Nicotinate dehydrogenase small FeS subunit n=2 Tax=Clostridium TaxID=1485 RepID=A0A151ANC9_9CLOT|nr:MULTISPECIES: 2Fe-2S iron-sulfur cluster-binding protein [Clostridium]KYH28917.1 nicotinate dehydrogenase small FeS subunit [Clostridium colicanis DSM 13634]MBE6044884.1 2Fe-2S iron-sulfur cluster binding domain-containing protein [Clostridium thermopalmarium]PRR73183.1 Nicotinate dehydrogenase small FeS subunit [Clostridium thermopalmarium DSM 5974]PVZ25252.1 carbon-monoxide dehydrogenase small subunit [Clostridium thermopalmarium DSM 5974]